MEMIIGEMGEDTCENLSVEVSHLYQKSSNHLDFILTPST